MKIEYQEAKSFKACGISFTLESTWNGLEEWRDGKCRKLIVSRYGESGFEVLGDMFGSSKSKSVTVISATPDLLLELKEYMEMRGSRAKG